MSRFSQRYHRVRAATSGLAEGLSAEDCALQSMTEASPVKWHLAHTSWFFETFLLEPGLTHYRPYEPSFRVLFNSYYVAVGERHPRPQRGLISRPGLDEVLAYRAHVDAAMHDLLQDEAAMERLAPVLELGLHHEQQHQELVLTDLKHLFSHNPLKPVYRSTPSAAKRSAPGAGTWQRFEGGLGHVGHGGDGFAFDNEMPRHPCYVGSFELCSHPVTNGEYRAFMEDGGYARPGLWLSDGWDAACSQGWRAPLYWEQHDGGWQVYTLAGMRPVDDSAPVAHVSYYEADAYARWAGARLPTEEEWETAARDVAPRGNFVESGRFHPACAAGDGLVQLFGDVWEWTASAYLPYPGYRAQPGALGEYNGKFMCNQFVLRGGSCVTPESHIRRTYRNFFPPAARWQFSGLRLARDAG